MTLKKNSKSSKYLRTLNQQIFDFIFFPLRALTLFEENKWGLTSLRNERFDHVAREVKGYCLDIGCGRYNTFIKYYCNNNGIGIDVYPYEGLTKKNVVRDLKKFPYKSNLFDTVTFIANINHIPRNDRDKELKEAFRCLKNKGSIIITMGNPLTEILVHKLVHTYDTVFNTLIDVDSERGMHEHENYYLTDKEIISRLKKAKFKKIRKKYFFTQWGLNHMFIAYKDR